MNTSSATRGRGPLVGAVLAVTVAVAVAVGTALAAGGATPDTTRTATAVPAARGGPPSTAECAAMGAVAADAAAATSSTGTAAGTASAVHAIRGRAALVARSTTSDDVRELAQNLADDLAAYRVAVASKTSGEQAQRRTETGTMVRDDAASLRRLCGR